MRAPLEPRVRRPRRPTPPPGARHEVPPSGSLFCCAGRRRTRQDADLGQLLVALGQLNEQGATVAKEHGRTTASSMRGAWLQRWARMPLWTPPAPLGDPVVLGERGGFWQAHALEEEFRELIGRELAKLGGVRGFAAVQATSNGSTLEAGTCAKSQAATTPTLPSSSHEAARAERERPTPAPKAPAPKAPVVVIPPAPSPVQEQQATPAAVKTAPEAPQEALPEALVEDARDQAKDKVPGPAPLAKGKGKGPPAPPPPAKAKSLSQPRPAQEAWFAGRRLHWRELPCNIPDVRDSIFNLDDDGRQLAAGLDWQDWHELFDARSDASQPLRRGSDTGKKETTVLSGRQATCAGVLLQGVGDTALISQQLLALEPLPEESVDRLQELLEMVEDKQAQQLLDFAKKGLPASKPPLRALERQLLPLLQMDRVRSRLRLARIASSVQTQAQDLCLEVSRIAAASQDVRKSVALKDLVCMALAVRSYVQHGPEALRPGFSSPQRAMEIGSLLSGMREFKAVAPGAKGVSLLHFLAHSLLSVRPDHDTQLRTELSQLPGLELGPGQPSEASAPALSSWAGLCQTEAQLRSDAEFAEAELQASLDANSRPGSSPLASAASDVADEAADALAAAQDALAELARARLEVLAGSAKDAAAEAAGALAAAKDALGELAAYFSIRGGTQKEPPGLLLLGQLSDLVRGFLLVCDEVRARP
eukprot:TRINITY_DN47834_c0_g1_i1.p1 TRINITY_DN47834_c0_g1~~TRINITY_DN47834_c0_g1_i1.p1  ORF type:complete len:706 (-),score=153.57 TRINITY_DN47834_c0_g1_i1:43-2160(-)